MSQSISASKLTEAVLAALEETFENVHGMYLDKGTSLFETLETITAEEASHPVSENCATVAAHVAHLRVSIETVMQYMRGERPQVDWTEVWRTVDKVTAEEWLASKTALREAYDSLHVFVNDIEAWDRQINMVLAILMHNAYHLGEIRHALCTIKTDR